MRWLTVRPRRAPPTPGSTAPSAPSAGTTNGFPPPPGCSSGGWKPRSSGNHHKSDARPGCPAQRAPRPGGPEGGSEGAPKAVRRRIAACRRRIQVGSSPRASFGSSPRPHPNWSGDSSRSSPSLFAISSRDFSQLPPKRLSSGNSSGAALTCPEPKQQP